MNRNLLNQIRIPSVLLIAGLGLLWGAAFPAIEVIVRELPPLTSAGIRYGVAGMIVLAYAAATTDQFVPRRRSTLLGVLVVGAFMFGGYQGALFIGTQYVSGAVAAVVVSLSPVIAALFAVPLLGETRGIADLCGFLLGIAGVAVVAQPGGGSGSGVVIGVLLILLGTALFAAGSVTVQLVEGRLPLEALLGWGMLIGAVSLFATALLRGESLPTMATASPTALAALAYVTVVAGALGYLLYFRLVRAVGATETTLVAYFEPVFATVVSVALFGHLVDVTTMLGFLAVVTGFVLVSRATIAQAVGPRYDQAVQQIRMTLRGL